MRTHRHTQPCLLGGKTQTILVFLWYNFWMWDYRDTQLNHVKIYVVVGVTAVRTENEMWEMVLWFFAGKMDGRLWALPIFPWAVMSWCGSASAKSLLHHCDGAALWRERDGADLGNLGGQARRQGQPCHQDWDGACCWDPQPDQEEWSVLCLTLFPLMHYL